MKLSLLKHDLRAVQHRDDTLLAVFRKVASDVKSYKFDTRGGLG